MITVIIFSKDRACQLDLLLRSMEKNLRDFECCILYTYSDENFNTGYKKLINKFSHHNFVLESNFRDDTIRMMKQSNCKNIALACDDNVIYRKQPEDIDDLNIGECFSLRLGLNTILQDFSTNLIQPPLRNYQRIGEKIYWNAEHYYQLYNYGYPYSIDFHCYNRNHLVSLVSGIQWSKTNELEGNLFQYRHLTTNMIAFTHSIAVNIPLNNLSGYTHCVNEALSNEILNSRYLDGEEIDLEYIGNQEVIGSHQEINIQFK